jgi:hypothetical protein
MGPSSFDVDRRGQIALADPLQGRVAFFASGRLVRQTGLPLGPRTDVAFADDASTYVTSLTPQFTTSVARIDSRGRVASSSRIGSPGDEPSEIRSAGSAAFVHVLPADAWESASSAIPGPPSVGRPLPGGSQLLKVVDGNAVRLGTVVGARVQDAVELDFQTNVAELALAEPDGHHGYWTVVHVWQESPTQADQYQVVHVDSALHVTTFAVPAEEFAETMPLSRFRLGGDGGLYELTSSADGIRIVRYDLGGNR